LLCPLAARKKKLLRLRLRLRKLLPRPLLRLRLPRPLTLLPRPLRLPRLLTPPLRLLRLLPRQKRRSSNFCFSLCEKKPTVWSAFFMPVMMARRTSLMTDGLPENR
jgi:hypothetical protein